MKKLIIKLHSRKYKDDELDYNLLSKEISKNPYNKKIQSKIIKTDADREEFNKIIESWKKLDKDFGSAHTAERNTEITKRALIQVLVHKLVGEDDWNKK